MGVHISRQTTDSWSFSFWMSARNYVGTYFIQDNDEPRQLLQSVSELEHVRFVVGQLEECPDTGRRHIQFYLELTSPRRVSYFRGVLPNGVHLEKRRGSREQAIEYCEKEESRVDGPWEFGRREQRPGKRNDLEALHGLLSEGATMREVSDEHFSSFLRYHRGIEKWRLLHRRERDWEMEVNILWGKTGTGKTRSVYERAKESGMRVFSLPQNDGGIPWFDGYDGEDIILIDDFYGWLKVSWLLKLMDRYAMQVQTKGGTVEMVSKIIYFTSNKDPENWYDWERIGEEVKSAFFRRVTNKRYFF